MPGRAQVVYLRKLFNYISNLPYQAPEQQKSRHSSSSIIQCLFLKDFWQLEIIDQIIFHFIQLAFILRKKLSHQITTLIQKIWQRKSIKICCQNMSKGCQICLFVCCASRLLWVQHQAKPWTQKEKTRCLQKLTSYCGFISYDSTLKNISSKEYSRCF